MKNCSFVKICFEILKLLLLLLVIIYCDIYIYSFFNSQSNYSKPLSNTIYHSITISLLYLNLNNLVLRIGGNHNKQLNEWVSVEPKKGNCMILNQISSLYLYIFKIK